LARRTRVGRHLLAAGAVAGLALGVAACGTDGDDGGNERERVTVGLITKRDTNPFFVKMKEAAQEAAKANNVELLTAAGKTDTDNQSQVTAIENMTTRGAKGILITPADSKAIVPAVRKSRAAGVIVIALDTPTEPQSAVDALFATDNRKAGLLIGQWAKRKFDTEKKEPRIAMLDLAPGISVGQLRHDGFLEGFGIEDGDPQIVGAVNTEGDTAKGQTGMEQLLQKDPRTNLVYSINEPSGFGAATALRHAGKKATIVSVDGGCEAIRNGVNKGVIDATSQQYPQNMAKLGVEAVARAARGGSKPSGYKDTGVTLITDDPVDGVESKDSEYGLENCWG
jgi:fructose transport system substrate-binding protein